MKPRVAVCHPGLVAGGGSEACAMWMLQALQDDYRVTLMTMDRPDLESLDRTYGTRLDPGRIEVLSLPLPPGTRKRLDALRGFRLARAARRRAGEYEVMISAYNVMDFGRPGIQRVGDFSFDDAIRRELYPPSGRADGLAHGDSPWRVLYLGLARRLAGQSGEGWRMNRTLANSEWTRRVLAERFGLASEVVYPPVVANFPAVPWAEREDGFVVIGRLVPEKGIGEAIAILSEVRKERPVHLHIVGRRERGAHARALEALCLQNREWVHLEGEVYGPAKADLLARHKYGLSACRNEAFGIAVAEMVKAGAIVWVPDGGGQTEIVGRPELLYSGRGEAVSRILSVLGDAGKQEELRSALAERSRAFSSDRFVADVRRVVSSFLEGERVADA